MKLGDTLIPLALLAWMAVTVGPWWIGAAIFCGAFALNILQAVVIAHPPAWLVRWALRRAKS